jgi:drug/metabolite transporter (DMT)-like permease
LILSADKSTDAIPQSSWGTCLDGQGRSRSNAYSDLVISFLFLYGSFTVIVYLSALGFFGGFTPEKIMRFNWVCALFSILCVGIHAYFLYMISASDTFNKYLTNATTTYYTALNVICVGIFMIFCFRSDEIISEKVLGIIIVFSALFFVRMTTSVGNDPKYMCDQSTHDS